MPSFLYVPDLFVSLLMPLSVHVCPEAHVWGTGWTLWSWGSQVLVSHLPGFLFVCFVLFLFYFAFAIGSGCVALADLTL